MAVEGSRGTGEHGSIMLGCCRDSRGHSRDADDLENLNDLALKFEINYFIFAQKP